MRLGNSDRHVVLDLTSCVGIGRDLFIVRSFSNVATIQQGLTSITEASGCSYEIRLGLCLHSGTFTLYRPHIVCCWQSPLTPIVEHFFPPRIQMGSSSTQERVSPLELLRTFTLQWWSGNYSCHLTFSLFGCTVICFGTDAIQVAREVQPILIHCALLTIYVHER